MVYKDLPVGAKFLFGKITKMFYNSAAHREEPVDIPIEWIKTAVDGLAIKTPVANTALYVSFDHPRPSSGTNRYERVHGTRLYFESSLHKFLNVADDSWRQVCDGDIAPRERSSCQNGFLSLFTECERSYIVPRSITVPVPSGYIKKHGESMTKTVYASLPSAEQLGARFEDGTFGIDASNMRSYITDPHATMISRYYYSSRQSGVSDDTFDIAPVIKIKEDAPIDVEYQEGAPNRYIIRIPESDFTGDIASFLGIQIAA